MVTATKDDAMPVPAGFTCDWCGTRGHQTLYAAPIEAIERDVVIEVDAGIMICADCRARKAPACSA